MKLLRGNPGKLAIPKNEPQPASELECPAPPSFLASYAVHEWHQIAPELHRLGLLTLVDTVSFAAYCEADSRWRTAEETIARLAAGDHTMVVCWLRRPMAPWGINPLVRIASRAANDMVRFATEFGLTPVARARIAAGVGGLPGPNKFDGLLG